LVNKFILQWHITSACNLRCKHCYQNDYQVVQLTKDQLWQILAQYRKLLQELKVVGHINLTGGEPLLSPYFYDLLAEFEKDKELYSFSILTNGSLINEENAGIIARYGPEYVQLSLEGNRKTNDNIRGLKSYKQVATAVKQLRKQGTFVSLAFTAHKQNYKEFPQVVDFALKNQVNNVWSDRYIPLADDKTLETLNAQETQEYLQIMHDQHLRLQRRKNCHTTVAMYRALQFLKTGEFAYACTAGKTLLTVMENGDLVPCRRLPLIVGNVLESDMLTLLKNNKTLQKLKSNAIPRECQGCEHEKSCQGGLKCLTYALYGDLDHKDWGCILE